MSTAQRLREVLRAVNTAVQDVSIGEMGNSASVTVMPSSAQASVQSAINSFDWSDAAHDIWIAAKIRDEVKVTFDNVEQSGRVYRAVVAVLIDEINTLRQELNLLRSDVRAVAPTVPARTLNDRTTAQARTAFRNKVDNNT